MLERDFADDWQRRPGRFCSWDAGQVLSPDHEFMIFPTGCSRPDGTRLYQVYQRPAEKRRAPDD